VSWLAFAKTHFFCVRPCFWFFPLVHDKIEEVSQQIMRQMPMAAVSSLTSEVRVAQHRLATMGNP
jgi:hypothetical protein